MSVQREVNPQSVSSVCAITKYSRVDVINTTNVLLTAPKATCSRSQHWNYCLTGARFLLFRQLGPHL